MAFHSYREVLSVPGAVRLFMLNILARLPICASGMVLTLHVVLGLQHSFTAAGLAGAAVTIGIALGAPLMGRVLDSYGLRLMVVVTTIAEGAFWFAAWALPYEALLIAAFISGLLALPAMSLGRQAVAALVPTDRRRTALSLDSISVEITYMIGPALGVLLATKVSSNLAMAAVGAAMVFAGIALYLVNPAILHADEQAARATSKPPMGSWLRGRMIAMLLLNFGAMFTLAGAELATVGALSKIGEVDWTGVVVGFACVASVVGGLVYGAWHRPVSAPMLMIMLTVLTIPVGLAGGEWWLLALVWAPSNLACAPAIAAINEEVMHLSPAAARGTAMGLSASASTIGLAISSPLTGYVIDSHGPQMAFVVAGVGGLLTVVVGGFFGRTTTTDSTEKMLAVNPK